MEVKTHFIAPAQKRGDRGLCQGTSFDKDAKVKLPKVCNCPDWDIDKEIDSGKKACPVCQLYQIARQALKEDPTTEEKKYFEALLQSSRPRTVLKWNVFDRDNPNVTVVDENGNESKQKGLKIASIGMEAWNDIEGIFEQCGFDITDPEDGIDICVKKGHNGTRVEYSAQVVLEGKGLKVSPFDAEEKEIVAGKHDLKAICGKKVSAEDLLDALHGDYRELLELNEDVPDSNGKEDSSGDDDAGDDMPPDDDIGDDEDALIGGSNQKKK